MGTIGAWIRRLGMSSRRSRIRRRNKRPRRLGVALGLVGLTILIFIGAGAVSAYAVVHSWLRELPDIESPGAFDIAQATRIYSADGKLLARLYLENRTIVPTSRIATDLVNATVAVEDERFYSHRGVDILGIARAAVSDIIAGDLGQGASTITQQYVRNTVLSDERTQISFARKFREAYLARELEKRRTKAEILELYLNTVYFGEGAYGAEAAAQTFFAKPARNLTLPEAALLAGLPQGPSRLSPYDNAEGARLRRAQVLRRMLVNGYIDQEQFDEADDAPIKPKQANQPAQGIYRAHYFVAHVKKLLQQEYGQAAVFKGGLRVYTTLDTTMQALAERAVSDFLDEPGDPDGALVSIDPRNGTVKAMVGGRDYSKNKFNLATQGKRQPGSSFKTFVLVTALEEGMPPHRYVDSSSPAYIDATPEPWVVSNSEGRGRGPISLVSATRSSVNTVFARLVDEIGAAKVARTAKRMGIASQIPAYPSIALGSQNVTPLEMASAYGTLATNGVHYPPTFITKVVDANNKVIFRHRPRGRRALTPEVAYAATDVLEGVISGGTARRAQIGRPAAGKTGTSQQYRDAWFVGYTPDLVTSVWVGHYKSEEPMLRVHGGRGFGGTLAAPIWHDFMKPALAGKPKLDFTKARKPKYTWKSAWSRPATETASPSTSATKTPEKPASPGPVTPKPPVEPPAEKPKEDPPKEKPPPSKPDTGSP